MNIANRILLASVLMASSVLSPVFALEKTAIEYRTGPISEPVDEVFDVRNKVPAPLSRITLYRTEKGSGTGATGVEVNGRYHTSLQLGSFSQLCFSAPANVTLSARLMHTGEAIKNYVEATNSIQLRQTQEVYVRVADMGNERASLQVVDAKTAQRELRQTRRQSHAVSLVSAFASTNNINDMDKADPKGIAITAVDTTKGTLWFSTNGGTTWSTVGSVSNTSALLLSADADNRVYFQPVGNTTASSIASAFTLRAWDGTSGTEGSKVDTTSTGGFTAFSTLTDTVAVNITTSQVKAISLSSGLVINGEKKDDNSGFSVSNAGDVNGDGLEDLIIGANVADPTTSTGNAGRTYVVFGTTNNAAINLSAVAKGSGGFVLNGGALNDNSGNSVTSLGDVNGDGLADLLVGARYADVSTTNATTAADAGKAYVVYGKTNTSAVNLTAVEAGSGGYVIKGTNLSDHAGYSVSSAGDVNGDGIADMIVGARYAEASGANTGRSAADQPLVISETYYKAVNDVATAQEEGNSRTTINPIGNVLSNDADVNSTGHVVTRVQFGSAPAQDIAQRTTSANGLVVYGQYGQLKIGADGSFVYEVDNTKAQSLSVKEKGTETFKYYAKNASGLSREAVLVITVNGANDAASFDDEASNYSGEWPSTASGNVVVTDPDHSEQGFTTTSTSTYGVFSFTQQGGTGAWSYVLNDTKTTFKNLKKDELATDTLTVTSIDGTASNSVVVSVKGENDAPVLTASTIAVASLNSNLNVPTSLAGATRVLDLVGNVSDTDHDALKGIAVTSIHSSGALWTSTDEGKTWTKVASASLSSAVLLAADNDTYVYFQQTGTGSAGTFDASAIDKAFTFKAWDQTSETGMVDARDAGRGAAFSSNAQDVVVNNTFNIRDVPTDLLVKGSTGFDTLKLTTTELTLDLMPANAPIPLHSIEKIDITGTGSNKIKLNLDSVMQADADGSIHKLYITGDNGDVVELTKPTNWEAAANPPTRVVSDVEYRVYQLNDEHELLINSAITNITFS